jgi:phosphohistidine phosphatase SixA
MKLRWLAGILGFLCVVALAADEHAATVAALRQGGLKIVMRHASSPRALPDAATANPDNPGGERQLDALGREAARAMGEALRRLDLPIGTILSSPTYRALETARLAGFSGVEVHAELSNEGMRESGAEQGRWLRDRVLRGASTGNTLIITHGPNIEAAFPDYARDMEEGEALILDPRDTQELVLRARIRIDAWPGY